DGIRDFHVTGVQTCALPILYSAGLLDNRPGPRGSQRAAMSIGRRSTSVATALGLAFCQGCGAGEVAEREAQPAIVAPEPTSFAELFQERGAVRLEHPDSAPLGGLSSLA